MKQKLKKNRFNLYLTDEQLARLEKVREKTGAPVAEIARRAIDEYLAKRKEEVKF